MPGKITGELTARQKRFIEEYLIDLNAAEAARRAGYAKRSAAQRGFETLRRPHVQEALTKAQAKRAKRTEIDQDYVLRNLKGIIESAEPSEAKATRALELLGKHLGMFKERVAIEGRSLDLSLLTDDEVTQLRFLVAKARREPLPDDV